MAGAKRSGFRNRGYRRLCRSGTFRQERSITYLDAAPNRFTLDRLSGSTSNWILVGIGTAISGNRISSCDLGVARVGQLFFYRTVALVPAAGKAGREQIVRFARADNFEPRINWKTAILSIHELGSPYEPSESAALIRRR